MEIKQKGLVYESATEVESSGSGPCSHTHRYFLKQSFFYEFWPFLNLKR